MNLGSNFNNRKLFTGESQSTTRSIDINKVKEKFGVRSVDEVRMSRIRLKDQLNTNIYGPNNKNIVKTQTVYYQNNQPLTKAEKQFNHVEAMRNIRRGI